MGSYRSTIMVASGPVGILGIRILQDRPILHRKLVLGTSLNKRKKEGQGLERPSPNGKAVPSLPLLFLLLLLLREEDVADGDVHLGNSQTNQVLDPSYDVRAYSLSHLVDGPTVHGAHDVSYRLCGGAAHPDALYLLSRDPSNLGDDAVLDCGGAAFSFQRALLVLSPVVGRLCTHAVSLLCPTLLTGAFAHKVTKPCSRRYYFREPRF